MTWSRHVHLIRQRGVGATVNLSIMEGRLAITKPSVPRKNLSREYLPLGERARARWWWCVVPREVGVGFDDGVVVLDGPPGRHVPAFR